MKFRIWTILWVFALLASAMATFGGGGIWLTLIVLFFWALVFHQPKLTVWEWLTIFGVVIVLIAMMLPAVQSAREAARRNSCMNNMKQILLAMLNYHDSMSTFPPASSIDANGEKLFSWRCLILPELEYANVHKRLRRDEPWNSTYHTKLFSQVGPLELYQCPAHDSRSQDTDYFAIVGERAAWLPDRGRGLKEFTDGLSNTIVLMDAPHKKVPWAKPEDLSFDEAVELLSNPPLGGDFGHEIQEGFFYKPSRGINVGFADGHVQFLALPISKQHAAALLTVDGGENVNLYWEEPRLTQPELDYSRIYSLSVFVLLSLLPIVKLQRKHVVKASLLAAPPGATDVATDNEDSYH